MVAKRGRDRSREEVLPPGDLKKRVSVLTLRDFFKQKSFFIFLGKFFLAVKGARSGTSDNSVCAGGLSNFNLETVSCCT